MNFKELFIDKSKTLIVNTDLALVLGDLNEAIVLNQLNYWLEINKKADKNFIDDRYWVYNSYSDWKAKPVITCNLNKCPSFAVCSSKDMNVEMVMKIAYCPICGRKLVEE